MEQWLNRVWYEREKPPAWLLPLEWLFILLSGLRRWAYRSGLKKTRDVARPVVVVGNITVGGTGKTPLVRHLCKQLVDAGIRPGIISRGHGGAKRGEPLIVHPDDPADVVGDEPLLLAQATGVPVCVFPRRVRAAEHLINNRDVDVIISDDGLQHYALERTMEIIVVDARRGVGNGHRLPAGPLREPASRLANADLVVAQGDNGTIPAGSHMRLEPTAFVNLADGRRHPVSDGLPDDFPGGIVAVAGIGNPDRFFAALADLGLSATTRKFADHHRFRPDDLAFAEGRPVIMTAKDAVKCRGFSRPEWWYLDVEARFDEDPVRELLARLRGPGS